MGQRVSFLKLPSSTGAASRTFLFFLFIQPMHATRCVRSTALQDANRYAPPPWSICLMDNWPLRVDMGTTLRVDAHDHTPAASCPQGAALRA